MVRQKLARRVDLESVDMVEKGELVPSNHRTGLDVLLGGGREEALLCFQIRPLVVIGEVVPVLHIRR